MNPSRQQEVIAQIHAQTGKLTCCRCRTNGEEDKPSSLFKYGAFFCSDECAERVSDYTLDYGQQIVPDYLNSLEDIRALVLLHWHDAKFRVIFTSCLAGLNNFNDIDMVMATPQQWCKALLMTLGKWED